MVTVNFCGDEPGLRIRPGKYQYQYFFQTVHTDHLLRCYLPYRNKSQESQRHIVTRVLDVVSATAEVVSVDAAEQRPTLGRHSHDLLVRKICFVPLGPQRVVAVEDGNTIIILGVPVHRGVIETLGEDDTAAGGALVAVHERVSRRNHSVRGFEVGFVAEYTKAQYVKKVCLQQLCTHTFLISLLYAGIQKHRSMALL